MSDRLSVLGLLVVLSCNAPKETPADAASALPDTALPAVATPDASPPPKPLYYDSLALEDDDRSLTITTASPGPAPCESTHKPGRLAETATVDLHTGAITGDRTDSCGVKARLQAVLTSESRIKLKKLMALMDAPGGTGLWPGANRHTITVVRADGGVSSRGLGKIDDHESEAGEIAALLDAQR